MLLLIGISGESERSVISEVIGRWIESISVVGNVLSEVISVFQECLSFGESNGFASGGELMLLDLYKNFGTQVFLVDSPVTKNPPSCDGCNILVLPISVMSVQ